MPKLGEARLLCHPQVPGARYPFLHSQSLPKAVACQFRSNIAGLCKEKIMLAPPAASRLTD